MGSMSESFSNPAKQQRQLPKTRLYSTAQSYEYEAQVDRLMYVAILPRLEPGGCSKYVEWSDESCTISPLTFPTNRSPYAPPAPFAPVLLTGT